MFKEDEYTELKSILTKDVKKEIVAFANSGEEEFILVLMMMEMLLV